MAKPPPRLWTQETLAHGVAFSLTKEQAHYLGTVLRLKEGDTVLFFNGKDGEWSAPLEAISRKGGVARPEAQTRPQPASAMGPDLFFAPLKKGPTDFIVQKATELGVEMVCPVLTDRTIAQRVPLERLGLIAREAAEQCERLDVPLVKQPVRLADLLEDDEIDHILFCDEAGDNPDARWGGAAGRAALPGQALERFATEYGQRQVESSLKNKDLQQVRDSEGTRTAVGQTSSSSGGRWAVLIGPEGGFTPAERQAIRADKRTAAISLGPRILKAETAALVALTVWQLFIGDLSANPDEER